MWKGPYGTVTVIRSVCQYVSVLVSQITFFLKKQLLGFSKILPEVEGKVVFEAITFGSVWPGGPPVLSDCKILNHQYLWKESIIVLDFLYVDNH